MAPNHQQRRLAAILAADIVGFSRLMEADEAGTMAALKARRRDVLDPLVAKHQGRVFKVTGDGVLAEFASAVNAVQCAVDLQESFAAANVELPDERHLILRIAVNLGDVMVEDGDLYGDGVNIAARLESLADPGGIIVSGTAYDHIKNNIKTGFDDLGTQSLKNIAEPVRAYRVAGTPAIAAAAPKRTNDKPSIAVLPFANMSGDPEQEYFSDGITEDIITELSRFRSLFVIARNSSFQYKGKNIDVRRVARELGVQYVVEGSVRKMGDRVRVTAQLIDTATGNHLWSERYDRSLNEIFAVQDELLYSIAARLEHRLAASVAEQAKRRPTEQLGAYDCVLQARNYINTLDYAAATSAANRAIDLDPQYAQAYAWLAAAIYTQFFFELRKSLLDDALAKARRAVELDASDAMCHTMLGIVQTFRREFDEARAAHERAAALHPNDTIVNIDYAHWLYRVGRHSEALERLDLVVKRDPSPPGWYWMTRFGPLFALKRYEEAIQSIYKVDRPHFFDYVALAMCFAQLGRVDEGRAAMSEALTMKPDYTIRDHMLQEPYKHQVDADHMIEALRKAGLPE